MEISIDDFRRLPHPDGKSGKIACTGDKIATGPGRGSEHMQLRVFDEVETAVGIKLCAWIEGAEFGSGSLSLANTGYGSYNYTFAFVPDPKDNVLRLYRYSGDTNVAAFEGITASLTKKWGEPTVTKTSVQNQIGNSFDKITAVWENPLASITVQSRWSKIDNMMIVMEDARLAKIVSDAKAAKRAATPNAI